MGEGRSTQRKRQVGALSGLHRACKNLHLPGPAAHSLTMVNNAKSAYGFAGPGRLTTHTMCMFSSRGPANRNAALTHGQRRTASRDLLDNNSASEDKRRCTCTKRRGADTAPSTSRSCSCAATVTQSLNFVLFRPAFLSVSLSAL